MTFSELLGEKLIQHGDTDNESKEISTDQLNGKTVALYFSAHWCPPCKRFTPKLAELFKQANDEVKNKFDIVYVSCDEDQAEFDEYYKDMPWKAVPFSNQEQSKKVGEKFNVEGIPCLVILSPTGEVISSDGVSEVRAAPNAVFQKWSEGKRLFWSREAREGEHVWEDTSCSECFMNPLLGTRNGCPQRECDFNLCETCLPKNQHEHPLVEYLIPSKSYTLEQLFKSVPHLLGPNNEDKIDTNTLWKDGVKTVGLYFSAHWCPPCRAFTPKLAEVYKEGLEKYPEFRLVFVSCDRDEESFNEYRSTMPWPSIPLNAGAILKSYFQFNGIPSLFILKTDGKILSRAGRDGISRKGVEAIKFWSQGEKVPVPLPEEFEWSSVTCDGCHKVPIVGQRYYCETCGNYDLCAECEKKGHEHPLKLIPPPSEDDDE